MSKIKMRRAENHTLYVDKGSIELFNRRKA
jgi:hypothetical protein